MDDMERMKREERSETRKEQFYKWGGAFTTVVVITTVVIVALAFLFIFVL